MRSPSNRNFRGSPLRGGRQGALLEVDRHSQGEVTYVSGGRAGIVDYSRTTDYSVGYRGGTGGPPKVLLDKGHNDRNMWMIATAACVLCLFILVPLIILINYLQPAPKFDCEAGYDNWQRGWSKEKQMWCCEADGVSCIGTMPLPGSDLLPKAKEESEEEEEEEEEEAIMLDVFTTTTKTTTATTTTSITVTGTTTTVTTTTVTTTVVTTTALFDCWAGYEQWEHGWSPQKKEWCCREAGLGCPSWERSLYNKWVRLGMAVMFLCGCFFACVYCCICQCCCSRCGRDGGDTGGGGGGGGGGNCATHAEQAKDHSMQEINKRLHAAGAGIGHHLSVSLIWDTEDDLDLRLELPNRMGHIDCMQKERGGGILDLDANNVVMTTRPVENIFWPHGQQPPHGHYIAKITLFKKKSHECHWGVKIKLDEEVLIFSGTIITEKDSYTIPFTYPHDNFTP